MDPIGCKSLSVKKSYFLSRNLFGIGAAQYIVARLSFQDDIS